MNSLIVMSEISHVLFNEWPTFLDKEILKATMVITLGNSILLGNQYRTLFQLSSKLGRIN